MKPAGSLIISRQSWLCQMTQASSESNNEKGRSEASALKSQENGSYCPESDKLTMTKNQYRKILEELDMSQRGAARLLGVSERSSRRFAAGDEIPQGFELLLVAMRDWNITPEQLYRAAGKRLPKEPFADAREINGA